ncbi:unnamed protein product, partial [Rotaria sp. Silwood2]
MKAQPNEKRNIKHRNAQLQWSEIKWNEEYVKEKIEEYLEIYNELGASSDQGLERMSLPNSSNQSKTNRNEEQPNNFDDFHNDNDDDDQEKNKNKKDYRIKKRKPFDDELIEDLRELPPVGKVPLEPLSKTKRQGCG